MSAIKKPGATAKRGRAAPRGKPLYQRGGHALYETASRGYQIVSYDPVARRERYQAGGKELQAAIEKLDRLHCGHEICQACGQAVNRDDEADSDLISRVISDYLIGHAKQQSSGGAIADRLAHVTRYMGSKPLRVGNITETWVKDFRKWLTTEPYYVGGAANRRPKFRKLSTAENSIVQLAAAIRYARKIPLFKPKQFSKFENTPDFRADVPLLAAMFRWCLLPAGATEKEIERKRRSRVNMLYYLRLSVATFARPDAVLDANLAPAKKQWASDARVFRLNPAEREQTKKHRATVPVPEAVGQWLDSLPKGPILPAQVSKATWGRMMAELKPGLAEGEGGMKLIRRSMAKLALDRMGLENEAQIQKMMGHMKFKITDIYTLPHPGLLGRALAFTTEIVDEIEALVPGAFNRNLTATSGNVLAMRT